VPPPELLLDTAELDADDELADVVELDVAPAELLLLPPPLPASVPVDEDAPPDPWAVPVGPDPIALDVPPGPVPPPPVGLPKIPSVLLPHDNTDTETPKRAKEQSKRCRMTIL
jgi:hypothetical protein